MNTVILAVIAVTGFLTSVLHIAHLFKLDTLAADKLDAVADAAVKKAKATEDPNDDKLAEAEAAVVHAGAAMIRDGKVEQGLALLDGFLKRKAA